MFNKINFDIKKKIEELTGKCSCIYRNLVKKDNKKCYYHSFMKFLLDNKVLLTGDWLKNHLFGTQFSDNVIMIYHISNKIEFDLKLGEPYNEKINMSTCYAYNCPIHGNIVKTFNTKTIKGKTINWILTNISPYELIRNQFYHSIDYIAYDFYNNQLWCPHLSIILNRSIVQFHPNYSKCKDINKMKNTNQVIKIRNNIYKSIGYNLIK